MEPRQKAVARGAHWASNMVSPAPRSLAHTLDFACDVYQKQTTHSATTRPAKPLGRTTLRYPRNAERVPPPLY